MDNIAIWQEMLRYIDAHIKEKLNVELLAQRAGFSPYYFCRRFQYNVGYSIMEYVRNRRLAYAASELSSSRKILDIAIDYGFETHSGFSKAFRRFFGCPPEIYRTYAVYNVPQIPDLTKSNQFFSGQIIEPKIMAKKAAFKIAGFPFKLKPQITDYLNVTPQFWEECKSDGRLEKLHGESFVKYHAEYGACFFKEYENKESVYVIGLEVKARHNIPAAYNVYTMPETLFAVFSTPPADEANFFQNIQGTWQYIFSEWFPNSGYEFDTNSFAFELYGGRSVNSTDKICDIHIPIVKIQL